MNEDAQKILNEAAKLAEQKIKEKLPEHACKQVRDEYGRQIGQIASLMVRALRVSFAVIVAAGG